MSQSTTVASAADEASEILKFARARADTGDLMMSVIADHIDNIEKELRKLKASMEKKV